MDLINIFMNSYINYYSSVADIGVLLLSTFLICMIYPFASFRERSNRTLLLICLVLENIASIADIVFYALLSYDYNHLFITYVFHFIYHVALSLAFYIFVSFYWSITAAPKKVVKRHLFGRTLILILYAMFRIILFAVGVIRFSAGITQYNLALYLPMLYYAYMGIDSLMAFILYDNKHNITHIYVKVSALISYIGLWITIIGMHTTALSTLLFLLPMIALAYYHHSYSFDVSTGAVDYQGFQHYLNKHLLYGTTKSYCGTVVQFVTNDDISSFVSGISNHTLFRGMTLFSYTDKNQYIYLYSKSRKDVIRTYLHKSFDETPVNYLAYSFDDLTTAEDIQSVVSGVYTMYKYTGASKWSILKDEDIDRFIRLYAIRTQLVDICAKGNLNDDRVLVYCQPIYNTHSQGFDTAEALMRLELPNLGFIYPGEFIPIAEEFHLIHSLTLIILNKVSAFVEYCNNNSYDLKRISVNFSMDEFRNKNICNEIYDIIDNYNIHTNQIALELTESMNNMNVEVLSKYLNDIKSHNIMLYLDDFGTGYSNFTRIYELPFDVIKFDMGLLMDKNDERATSINSVIPYFKKSGFKLVHEGVETDIDETNCIDLGFDYLQGYKYSKPIPIAELVSFLRKIDSVGVDEK